MIEIARTQDEQVGDGTTSVIILAGEMLAVSAEFMEQQMHPIVVIGAYLRALEDGLKILDTELAVPVDVNDREKMIKIIEAVIGTKILKKWYEKARHCSSSQSVRVSQWLNPHIFLLSTIFLRSHMACNIALDAVRTVQLEEHGHKEIDIKRYAKVRGFLLALEYLVLRLSLCSGSIFTRWRKCPVVSWRILACSRVSC